MNLDIKTIISLGKQILKAKDKVQAISNLTGINPQKVSSIFNQANQMTDEKKAEFIANWCNENNISKTQISRLLNRK